MKMKVLCNRCGKKYEMEIKKTDLREANRKCFRIMKMMTLPCGHRDTHWVRKEIVKQINKGDF